VVAHGILKWTMNITSSSSKASKEVCLSGPSLEMEVLPYHFEPDPSPADSHLGVHLLVLQLKRKLIAYAQVIVSVLHSCRIVHINS